MIDFENAKYLKLRAVDPERFLCNVSPMLVEGEPLIACYQSI